VGNEKTSTKIKRDFVILSLYAVLAVAGTYPLMTRVFDALPQGGDSWVNYWNLWWVKKALLVQHTSPYFTSDVYFPYGTTLYFHTLNFLPAVIALPIASAFEITAAFNFLAFLSFVLSGYGIYRLALYVLARLSGEPETGFDSLHLSAFVAGSVFAFCSYRYVHLFGHLDLLSTQWLPLFVLFLLRTRDEGRRRDVLIAAIFLAAAMLTSAYYMVFLLLFTALVTADLVIKKRRIALQPVLKIALVVVVFVILVSPILVPMLMIGRTEGRTFNPALDVDRFSTDLTAFLVPSPLPPLWKNFVEPTYRRIIRPGSSLETVAFVGFAPLALFLIGVTRFGAIRKLWLPLVIIFGLIALGPAMHLAGHVVLPQLSFLMPYRLLALLPYGDIARVPARYVVMMMLCLSVIAGSGAWVVLRKRAFALQCAIAGVITVISVAENAVVTLPLMSPHEPAFFRRIRNDPGRKGLVEVPIPDDPVLYPERMLYQTIHEKPIYGGYLSRGLPPLPFSAVPGFAQFYGLSESVDDVVAYDSAELRSISRAVLNAYSAGYIVIEKNLMNVTQVERARQVANELLGDASLAYEDMETLAYTVPPSPSTVPTAIWLDRGWSYLERLPEKGPGGRPLRWHWMGESSRLGVLSANVTSVRLKLTAQAFGRERRLQLTSNGSVITTIAITPDRKDFETPVFTISPDTKFLELKSLDGADSPGQDARRLSVAIFRLEVIANPSKN
jgi:hypothetical protein